MGNNRRRLISVIKPVPSVFIFAAQSKSMIEKEMLTSGMGYNEYRELTAQMAAEGKTTGPEQSESRIDFTKLNESRMKRLDKTIEVPAELKKMVQSVVCDHVWILLSESWCGDSAQNIPIIAKVAEASPKVELRVLLRDENLEFMDRYITNGGRGIPKLIAFDKNTLEELWQWGPRPAPAQQLMLDNKRTQAKPMDEVKKDIQVWYNNDKGRTLIEEFLALLAPCIPA